MYPTVVGGERGQQLAAAQATSILEVLGLFGRPAAESDQEHEEAQDPIG
jgi:hypothetical protein